MILRVPFSHLEDDKNFTVFYETMKRLKCFDEYALFTHDRHTPPPLEEMQKRLSILKCRIAELKKISGKVGINHLCTLGHTYEDKVYAYSNRGRFFTGIDGRSIPGNFCPCDEEFRLNYIAPVYRMIAEIEPDFIYIDDDIRLINHGDIRFGCFCDVCFERLKQHFDFAGNREEFRKSFDGPLTFELRERRKKMLQWNRDAICDLSHFIADTVHEINPHIIFGQMDTSNHWCADRIRQVEILRGPMKNPVRWRPGGGVFDDTSADALVGKAHKLGWIASQLPPSVQNIDSEVENFPSANLSKSRRFTIAETSVYCAAGCTGTALNIICAQESAPLDLFEDLMLGIKKQNVFNDKIVSGCAGLPPVGIWHGCDNDYFLGNSECAEHWIAQPNKFDANFVGGHLHMLGLPIAYSRENAVCSALSASRAAAISDDAILDLLSTGVYLDAGAVDVLHERGFSKYLKLRTGRKFENDALEEAFAGNLTPLAYLRNINQGLWGGVATELEPTAEDVQILSHLVDYHQNKISPCASAVFTTSLGGRVCVSGYAPWDCALFAPRNLQLHQIFRWLSGERLPLEVTDLRVRTTVWARPRPDGSCFACVYNASFDDCQNLQVRVNGRINSIRMIRDNGEEVSIPTQTQSEYFSEFRIPEIKFMELICLDTMQ